MSPPSSRSPLPPAAPADGDFESSSPGRADHPRASLFAHTGPVTGFLMAVCVLVTLWSLQGVDNATLDALQQIYPGMDGNSARYLPLFISLAPIGSPGAFSEILSGQVWRLFTPVFIHFGLVHLVCNMQALQILGSAIETRHSRRFYLVLLVTLTVTTNLAQYIWSGPLFGGMSGVLYGLFGYIWLRSLCDPSSGFHVPAISVVLMLAGYLVCATGLLGYFFHISIGNTAHTTGLIVGAVWGVVTGRWAMRKYRG